MFQLKAILFYILHSCVGGVFILVGSVHVDDSKFIYHYTTAIKYVRKEVLYPSRHPYYWA